MKSADPRDESIPGDAGDRSPPAASDASIRLRRGRGEVPLADLDLASPEFDDEGIVDADRYVERSGDAATAESTSAKSTTERSHGRLVRESIPAIPPRLPFKRLVLIGAGHAHLQIVNWWRRSPIPNVDLILVSAFDQAAYSGMLPATLAGLYRPEEMLIDLPKLCARSGVRLIVDRANSLDPLTREIAFAHQPTLRFDLASINIGSVPAAEQLWQSRRMVIGVKPLSTFLDRFRARFQELVDQWNMAPRPEPMQVVVVGAGAGGVELAFCLEQRRYELELPIDVRIVDGCSEILDGYPLGVVRRVKRLFRQRGIEMSLGSRVVDCDDSGPSSLTLENGERIQADLVIWANGAAPPMALRGFRLPKSPQGFLTIRSTLQSTADVPVFVVGDIADLVEHSVPKAGVNSVRQATVLQRNLARWFSDQPLIEYHPQRSALSLLACGDGTAILSYKGFCSHGTWAWWLKDRLDRGWVRQFQVRET